MQEYVEHLGYRINTTEKVKAIQDAPVPRNLQELKSFLGVLHYYGKFTAILSSLLHPLNRPLQAGAPWKWTPACNKPFVCQGVIE